jgi:hypothetical protein
MLRVTGLRTGDGITIGMAAGEALQVLGKPDSRPAAHHTRPAAREEIMMAAWP